MSALLLFFVGGSLLAFAVFLILFAVAVALPDREDDEQ